MKFKALAVFSAMLFLFAIGTRSTIADELPRPFNTPEQKREYDQRHHRYSTLWRARKQRNVTSPLVAMLDAEKTPHLRDTIVIALGRIEDLQALQPLQKLLRRVQQTDRRSYTNWRDWIPEHHIQLAIGRIQARRLKGTAKLDRIAQSIGTNWLGVQRKAERLRRQLSNVRTRRVAYLSDDYQIIEEFYDVLYRMGKRGEDIRQLGAYNVVLAPQHEPLLSTSKMSDEAEVRFWLKRALPPSKTGFYPQHLLDLGPTVSNELMKYLKICLARAKANPKVMTEGRAYHSIFKAAGGTHDKRFIPVLEEFQKVNDHWTRIYARQAIAQLQSVKFGGQSKAN